MFAAPCAPRPPAPAAPPSGATLAGASLDDVRLCSEEGDGPTDVAVKCAREWRTSPGTDAVAAVAAAAAAAAATASSGTPWLRTGCME
eukprot:gene23492-biopygen22315